MKDKKDFQYKIFKSEACGHTIEYKMIKKEHELEKARVDEGKSATEKKQARKERSEGYEPHKRENRRSFMEQKPISNITTDDTGKTHKPTGHRLTEYRPGAQKKLKQKLQEKHPKSPSKEDLEYPMAASEEDCKCEDETKKCECEDKEMKKREKFYIQKIQELRKQAPPSLNLRQMYNIENSPARRDAAKARAGLEEAPSPSPYQSYNIKNSPARKDAIQAKAGNVKNFLTGQTSAAAAPASNMSMPGQAPAPQAAAPAPQAAAPAAQAPQSFGQAFKAARAARMGGTGSDTFEFGGKKYHSFTKDDFSQGLGSKYNSTTKQAPAAQAPAAQAPAAQAPAAQAPAAQAPAAQKSNAFQKLTGKNLDQAFEQNFPKSVNRKENGSTLKTFPSGKKELTNL